MELLVVGSVAMDSVDTPHGSVRDVLGGAAVYFSAAARHFTRPRMVGVVGRDFPEEYLKRIKKLADTDGLEVGDGETFRWWGAYTGDMNSAVTKEVHLNVLADFRPKLPQAWASSRFAFLANASPQTQMKVLKQLRKPKFVMADTMNLWIEHERMALLKLMKRVDALVVNDAEARMLSGMDSLIKACGWIRSKGPRLVVVKKGEHGAMLSGDGLHFVWPGYPTADVVDPTGAGDSFAGGFMGYLAAGGKVDARQLKMALVHGQVVASFNIESFSMNRLEVLRWSELNARLRRFVKMMSLE
ncbi:MAG TPA: PfkB family carbohydrate kinase [Candidatus Brocadiia bacterium]|nr:PfkB family carbohydrate kinase [Candidatus Brocadiia bacterium]